MQAGDNTFPSGAGPEGHPGSETIARDIKRSRALLANMTLSADDKVVLTEQITQLNDNASRLRQMSTEAFKDHLSTLRESTPTERLAAIRELIYRHSNGEKWLELRRCITVLRSLETPTLDRSPIQERVLNIQLEALLHALDGKRVDVLQENLTLADHDSRAHDFRNVARCVGISVASSREDMAQDADIVFSSLAQRSFDTLQAQYAGHDSRQAGVTLASKHDSSSTCGAEDTPSPHGNTTTTAQRCLASCGQYDPDEWLHCEESIEDHHPELGDDEQHHSTDGKTATEHNQQSLSWEASTAGISAGA